ncbi:MAG TPA: phosphate transport system regulatory protein PhoU, partial [Ruminococcaceae bacterium]|nr:phosphate transport system regulatory protein PhoU [Oscillospiraceae bacterium]
ATDLRLISSALKMISDMERIGDQAYDIAEIAKFIKNSNVKSRVHIKEMAAAAIKMVTDSVDSFVKKDIELARAVMDYDDKVDNLFNCIKDELVQLISEDRANGEFCIDLLMIAKYLERIGDHAVNIAEWVEYSITGTHR